MVADPRFERRHDDPWGLERFVEAQARDFDRAMAELRAGRKRSHWMWYVFPQIRGLGSSALSQRYAISGADEARAYLSHPVLGPRLHECAAAVLAIAGRSATEIFGSPDDLKLRSCATLFAHASPPGSVFERLLERYFDGRPSFCWKAVSVSNVASGCDRRVPGRPVVSRVRPGTGQAGR